MSWDISEKEYSAVQKLPELKRYSYFIKKISDFEEVWSLRNDDGWVLAASTEGQEVVPVWPHEKFARACAEAEWIDCKPAVIKLESWVDRWIPGMIKDDRMILVFATPDSKGYLASPAMLCDDLSKECRNYE